MVCEVSPGLISELYPLAPGRDLDHSLRGHLEEQEICNLLNVIAVIDAIVPEGVAEPPKLANYVTHAAIASFSSRRKPSSLPPKALFACTQPPSRERTGTSSKSSLSMERFAAKCSRMRPSHFSSSAERV